MSGSHLPAAVGPDEVDKRHDGIVLYGVEQDLVVCEDGGEGVGYADGVSEHAAQLGDPTGRLHANGRAPARR